MKRYEVIGADAGSAKADELCAEGWEPFGATTEKGGVSRLWFRREKKAKAKPLIPQPRPGKQAQP